MKIAVFHGGEAALRILTSDDGVLLWHRRGLDVGVFSHGDGLRVEIGNMYIDMDGGFVTLTFRGEVRRFEVKGGVLYEGEREEGNYTTVAMGPYIVLLVV